MRQNWAYLDLMPVVPTLNAGPSPVLQWLVIPLAGLMFERGRVRLVAQSTRSVTPWVADEILLPGSQVAVLFRAYDVVPTKGDAS